MRYLIIALAACGSTPTPPAVETAPKGEVKFFKSCSVQGTACVEFLSNADKVKTTCEGEGATLSSDRCSDDRVVGVCKNIESTDGFTIEADTRFYSPAFTTQKAKDLCATSDDAKFTPREVPSHCVGTPTTCSAGCSPTCHTKKTCTGLPSFCTPFATEGACTAGGCSWNQCVGSSCSAACNEPGCMLYAGCSGVGTEHACWPKNETQCGAEAGCSWGDSTLGECEPTTDGCAALTEQNGCAAASGCTWAPL